MLVQESIRGHVRHNANQTNGPTERPNAPIDATQVLENFTLRKHTRGSGGAMQEQSCAAEIEGELRIRRDRSKLN